MVTAAPVMKFVFGYFCRIDWGEQSRLAIARSSKDKVTGAGEAEGDDEEEGGETEGLLSNAT